MFLPARYRDLFEMRLILAIFYIYMIIYAGGVAMQEAWLHASCLLPQAFLYFQCLVFPSSSHSIVVASLLFSVSSVLASLIHSIYSRRCEGGKASNVASAFLLFLSAAASGFGNGSSFLGAVFGLCNFHIILIQQGSFLNICQKNFI